MSTEQTITTLQLKKNRKAIEIMFQNLDDEFLKTALLCAYAGEDESTLDAIVAQQKTDYEAKLQEMKLTSQDIIDVSGNQTDKQ